MPATPAMSIGREGLSNSSMDASMSMSMETDFDTDGNRTLLYSSRENSNLETPFTASGRIKDDNSSENDSVRSNDFSGHGDRSRTKQGLKQDVPMTGGEWSVEEARCALRKAAETLSRFGLKLASKWASEQLIGLAPSSALRTPGSAPTRNTKKPSKSNNFDFEQEDLGLVNNYQEEEEEDLELYAKALFDLGEYQRAAAVLSGSSTDDPTGDINAKYGIAKQSMKRSSIGVSVATAKASGGEFTIDPPLANLTSFGIYLRAYALYMAGERRKEEEVVELREPLERTTLRNSNLPQLLVELHNYYQNNFLDAFGLYIYGVVLKENQKNLTTKSVVRSTLINGREIVSAQSILIESLIQFPYNWSGWLDLAELCISDPNIHPEVEDLLKPISSHWMYHFFCVHVFLENQANENAMIVIDRLIQGTSEHGGGFFVQSPYLQSQLAVAHYNMRDFDNAQNHFNALAQQDTYRLDQMDVYSNILYVKEDKVALSQLAHRAMKIDKYRPESCCIVGNYYSLKSQHEKAVKYFQRALKLDRTYLSAWTLMGHEYLEMKNTAAAIEAYRRAVDINPRDYRAWYGLGQTYEIMNMLLYALFYYRKAVELRPYDARMWCAMGGCYLGLERRVDAIRSYERAVSNHDAEGIATKKLATLYREDGEVEQAARCYLRHLELRYQAQQIQSSPDSGKIDVENIINLVHIDAPEAEALLFLAYYHRDHGELETASMCCSRLLEYPGPEKEEGKALLREIRSRMDRKGNEKEVGVKPRSLKLALASNGSESFEFSP